MISQILFGSLKMKIFAAKVLFCALFIVVVGCAYGQKDDNCKMILN